MMDKIKWFVMEQSFRLLLFPTFCANLKIGNIWNDIQAKMARWACHEFKQFLNYAFTRSTKDSCIHWMLAISAGSKFRGEES